MTQINCSNQHDTRWILRPYGNDADEELHEHFADLLSNADIILYGRVTYQLMQFWQSVVKNSTGNIAISGKEA